MAAWRRPWRPCRSNTRRTWNNWRTGIIFTARNSASYRYCPMFNCCLSCVSDWRVSTKLSGTKSTKCTRRRQTNVMYWWRSRSEDTLTLFFPNTDLNCKLQITLISEWLQMDLLPQCSLFHNRVDSWFVTCKMFFFCLSKMFNWPIVVQTAETGQCKDLKCISLSGAYFSLGGIVSIFQVEELKSQQEAEKKNQEISHSRIMGSLKMQYETSIGGKDCTNRHWTSWTVCYKQKPHSFQADCSRVLASFQWFLLLN